MVSRILGAAVRRTLVAAGFLAIGAFATTSQAQEKSAYSVSLGTTFTSHFISYGADVWGGGGSNSLPFSSNSSIFGYGTVNVAIADNLSGFVNIWSDLNDNVDSGIGGPIQEIDVNTGLTYSFDKFSFTVAHGFWNYGGGVERVIDGTVAFNDADLIVKGFALNPSVNIHWRYDGDDFNSDTGGQKAGVAIVPSIKPSFTFMSDSKYPLTVGLPISAGWFATSGFQGNDPVTGEEGGSGYAYVSGGVSASVPLAFVPAKYGAWNLEASVTYYNTSTDAIPNNPNDNFIVTEFSVGVAF